MKKSILIISLFAIFLASCSVYQTYVNLSKLQFKISGVDNLALGSVKISNQSKISDFSFSEVLQLGTLLAQNKMPITFTLNVNAKNPNNGNGYPQTDITIDSFPWELQFKNSKILSGNISSPLVVPGKGNETVIPLEISFDLLLFFDGKNSEDFLELALAISGKGKDSSELILIANPVLGTPIGKLSYPTPIKITRDQFN
jgi:LEA14-like dessication related protein